MSEKFFYSARLPVLKNFSDTIFELSVGFQSWIEESNWLPERSGVVLESTEFGELFATKLVSAELVDDIPMTSSVYEVVACQSTHERFFQVSIKDFPISVPNGADAPDDHFPEFMERISASPLVDLPLTFRESATSDEVLRVLENPDRTHQVVALGPAAYARTAGLPITTFLRIVGTFADFYALNEASFEEFNEEVGIPFSIPRDGFRAFAPGLDVERSIDAKSHPSIWQLPNLTELETDDVDKEQIDAIRDRNIALLNRNSANYIPAGLLAHVKASFREQGTAYIKARSEQVIAKSTDLDPEVRELIEKLHDEVAAATEFAEGMEKEFDREKYERQVLEIRVDEYAEEVDQLSRGNAYLRGLLIEHGHFAAIDPAPRLTIWDEIPQSFRELVDSFAQIPYLVFTGDMDPVIDQDSQPQGQVGIRRAWESLRALSEYASLKDANKFDGGFYQYLTANNHGGYKVPNSCVAMSESEQVNVNPELVAARTFPVPAEVSGGGTIYMAPHVKLVTGPSNSPRMHFYDNTGGDNKIYIGYLGRHLPNPGTN